MQVGKIHYFKNPQLFRKWLVKNHATQSSVWLLFYKKHTNKPTMTYQQALDEALCYGWIDGILKSLGNEKHVIRFTPRRPNGIWSKYNLGHVRRLLRQSKMRAAGKKVLPKALLQRLINNEEIKMSKKRALTKKYGVRMY
ncbi:MAG: hypothetical protein V1685_07210 [Parcubacteria group bacterium]